MPPPSFNRAVHLYFVSRTVPQSFFTAGLSKLLRKWLYMSVVALVRAWPTRPATVTSGTPAASITRRNWVRSIAPFFPVGSSQDGANFGRSIMYAEGRLAFVLAKVVFAHGPCARSCRKMLSGKRFRRRKTSFLLFAIFLP